MVYMSYNRPLKVAAPEMGHSSCLKYAVTNLKSRLAKVGHVLKVGKSALQLVRLNIFISSNVPDVLEETVQNCWCLKSA